jgi:acyl dehydratase
MRELESLAELEALIGQEVAQSDWIPIDQDRINLFADATGDHQCFPSPVPVGSRLRAHFTLTSVEHLEPVMGNPGAQINWLVTIEREGSSKPVCVAESVSRRYGS